ncbi:MAG: hypothetical protein GY854_14175 [Deltaproteobacteria bacterium]|nr:hypothetical protein [Deltaproteobacteria bacterium]
MSFFVRIKPYDAVRGHIMRRYTYKGIFFDVSKGWYVVSDNVGKHLETVPQQAGVQHSPSAFDVCTEAEAKRIDAKEVEEVEPKRPADNARPALATGETSKDVAPKKRRGRKPKDDKAEKPEQPENPEVPKAETK